MKFIIDDWLHLPVTIDGMTTRQGDRLADLLTLNAGSWEVRGWGYYRLHANGHRLGLSDHEAVELARMVGFIDGVEWCAPGARAAVARWQVEYLRRWEQQPLMRRR